jgi:hypothetical protein
LFTPLPTPVPPGGPRVPDQPPPGYRD